ncbi:hypothetical protein BX666DRAFT_2052125 [Dichotomocladium elegans]|nr:hypothetical protein BX666DRAFT_2052125 [Dichotomocladium elegans]
MRVIWGFMLENTYFTEFDLSNHQIIEGAYRQRKTRQTSHYINIRDSHLPVQARVYFGVEQIHLRMPGTRYYVRRIVIASSTPSSTISSGAWAPSKRRRRTVSQMTQGKEPPASLPHSVAVSVPKAAALSHVSSGQGFTPSVMMLPRYDFNWDPPDPMATATEPIYPQPTLLSPPPYHHHHYLQAPVLQENGRLCSSSSTSTCTSGSSSAGTLDVYSSAATHALPIHAASAEIFQLSPWQQTPAQSPLPSIPLDHFAMADKSSLQSALKEQQRTLLIGAVAQSQTTAPQISLESQPAVFDNDMLDLVPWAVDGQTYAFGGSVI